MALTREDFVADLRARVPEFIPYIEEHVSENFGELLIHLLMADLRRFVIEAWKSGNGELRDRCLACLENAIAKGDDALENAVAVSFVEDVGWWDPKMRPFIATWPRQLKREAARQENWRPEEPGV